MTTLVELIEKAQENAINVKVEQSKFFMTLFQSGQFSVDQVQSITEMFKPLENAIVKAQSSFVIGE